MNKTEFTILRPLSGRELRKGMGLPQEAGKAVKAQAEQARGLYLCGTRLHQEKRGRHE